MGTASAQPAPASSTLSAVRAGAVRTVAVNSAAAAGCRIGQLVITRTSMCLDTRAEVDVLRNGKIIGRATFDIKHSMTLQAGKRNWNEAFTVGKATLVNASGIRVSVSVGAGKGITTKVNFPQGSALGAAHKGTVGYKTNVGKKQQQLTSSSYRFTFTKPGYTLGGFTYNSARYRCDDKLWGPTRRLKAPGCVFPGGNIAVNMGDLRYISENIRDIRKKGGHYGEWGYGKPLHRLDSEAQAKKNRDAVCGRAKPSAWERQHGLTSCDEYPFASTKEGGTKLPASQRGIKFVPPTEQDRQGGRISGFRKQFRVLDGDAFYVTI
ncbi:NucA/NucB deoxyribonuclease domain-containing protein [Streptomyces tropicalis]|uniref:NucA/NucB deoxyribonuclease domain-containing protein n=1 Tax=Streptomyces tropicalis TaxID=3034234 RepID=A0ABT6ACW9_9ACTN|nr:NucA/NucB deoxyribonuclease domain-containing protein [Streptomyces tropicalis]MDF3302487.1 NucA/NucB deoxyribonuclease domain-containing protein [Streptomyces tropicalis]